VKRDTLLALCVLVLALIPRLVDLDVFISPDETRWICRSTNFYAAIETGDLAQTYQKEHPGVITMWLGNLVRPVDPNEVSVACRYIPASKLVGQAAMATLHEIRDRLFTGRIRVALLTAIGVAAMFLLAVPLFGRATALLAAGLIALDPLLLGQSRVLHLDAVTTTFMTLSVLALLIHLLRDERLRWLVLSGMLGGLGALNKSPAMFLAPLVVLFAALPGWHRPDRWRWIARTVVVWGAAAFVTYVALWPAMWVTPVQAVTGVLRGAIGYAEDPHEGLNYFWGAIRPDPGVWFYPVAWLLRATPLVLLGAGVALARVRLRRGDRTERAALIILVMYIVLFTLFMTTGAKKFDRYLLPVFPAAILVASTGLAAIVERIRDRIRARASGERTVRLVWPAAITVVLGLQAALVLPHHPYYLSYYNPLLGGARAGQWALLVGWGEGIDQVAHYMNAQPEPDKLTVATRYRSSFGPLLEGRALEMDDYDPASLDYYMLYINQIQRDLDPALIARLKTGPPPVFTARFRGIDYAWLYANKNYVPVLDHIRDEARDGDVVIARADSQLAKHFDLSVPLFTFGPDDDAGDILFMVERVLGRMPRTTQPRVWYVRYDDIYPRPGLAEADYKLATATYTVSERHFPEVSVLLLTTRGGVDFDVQAPMHPLDASFGGRLRLTEYGFNAEPLRWGRELGLTLGWAADGDLDRNLTAFVHLVGADGRRWGQVDKPVTDADLVTTADWAPGARAQDRYHFGIPPGTPLGPYHLLIGVYDSASGERLPATVDGKDAPDNVASLDIAVDRSPFAPGVDDLGLVARSEQRLGDDLELLGYTLGGPVEGGGVAPVVLLWRTLQSPPGECRAHLAVRDETGATVGEITSDLGSPTFPTHAWRSGDIVRSAHDIPLDGRARAGDGRLNITRLDCDGYPAPVAGNPVELPLAITGPERTLSPPATLAHRVDAELGGLVTLLGDDVSASRVRPGDTVTVTLTWQARALIDTQYTVFVHLLDASGTTRAQVDVEPRRGARPTTSWLAGEVVTDAYILTVPPDAPPGRYTFGVGLYDARTQERLAATDADGRAVPDNRVILGRLDVRR
jgi:hypothetical protein